MKDANIPVQKHRSFIRAHTHLRGALHVLPYIERIAIRARAAKK